MPFTPFHFGVGLAVHAVAPKRVSFLSFCAANVLMDIEPLYYQLMGSRPYHRFFHTAAGGTVIIVATVLLFLGCRWLAEHFRRFNSSSDWTTLKFSTVVNGAAFGAYTHVMLDSITHKYLHPFAPVFKNYQPKLSVLEIHILCVMLGILGAVILAVRHFITHKNIARLQK
jgi:hypothetical protein